MGKDQRDKTFITENGEAATHALNGEWLEPSVNPFGHGCCDCGLFHQVEYRVVDSKGKEISGAVLQMKWNRDQGETISLRSHNLIEAMQAMQMENISFGSGSGPTNGRDKLHNLALRLKPGEDAVIDSRAMWDAVGVELGDNLHTMSNREKGALLCAERWQLLWGVLLKRRFDGQGSWLMIKHHNSIGFVQNEA